MIFLVERRFLLMLLLAVATAPRAARCDESPPSALLPPIFNGRDLAGWKAAEGQIGRAHV